MSSILGTSIDLLNILIGHVIIIFCCLLECNYGTLKHILNIIRGKRFIKFWAKFWPWEDQSIKGEEREKKVCFLSQQGAFLEAFLVLLMHRINLGRSALAPSPKGSFSLGLTMLGLLVRSNTCKQLPFLDITEYIKIRVSNFFLCVRKEKNMFFQQNSNYLKLFNKSYKCIKHHGIFDNFYLLLQNLETLLSKGTWLSTHLTGNQSALQNVC